MTKAKDSKLNLYIIVKSIDGGTGTFVLNLLKIKRVLPPGILKIRALVLERPAFRKIGNRDFAFLRPSSFFPQRYSFAPKNIFYFINELVWIKNNLPKKGQNILLGIDLRSNLLAIFSKIISLNRLKVIATTHINLTALTLAKSNLVSYFFLKLIIRYFYAKADALVCVSRFLSRSLRRDFDIPQRPITIYDGQHAQPTKPKSFSGATKKIIISVARFSVQKDHENLLKALALLLNKTPNVELWLVGDGPEKETVLTLIKRLDLKRQVRILGWRKNVYPLLKKSDIFVLSSKSEGFGYVLVEAMSQGIPVVSTDTPYGPSEILDKGKYGILVPMQNPKSLKGAIHRLLTNKNTYEHYAKKSVERSQFFSLERMLKGYKKVIVGISG